MSKVFFTFWIVPLVLFCSLGSADAGIYLNLKPVLSVIHSVHESEKKYGIPENLLAAIAHVESKCTPYAVNARGKGYFFKSKEQAMTFIHTLRAQGVRNINIGYMQLNLPSHLPRFNSIDDMLDLRKNIDFAASLLSKLYKQYGSWPKAVERYKSGFSEGTKRYQAHVYRIWERVKAPRIEKIKEALVTSHQFTLHKGGVYHTLKRISKMLPDIGVTKVRKKIRKSKEIGLETIKGTTFKSLATVEFQSIHERWEKTYCFSGIKHFSHYPAEKNASLEVSPRQGIADEIISKFNSYFSDLLQLI